MKMLSCLAQIESVDPQEDLELRKPALTVALRGIDDLQLDTIRVGKRVRVLIEYEPEEK